MDLVLIDAPCSGTGVWRRRPDAKWRLTPAQLAERIAAQKALLAQGALLVKPGGTLAYVTCSLLPEENGLQIEAFLSGTEGFVRLDPGERAEKVLSRPLRGRGDAAGLILTPAQHGTDGFYIALLGKAAA
jgi:16S rRNA (cytosine967-C5)-methyltransferase